MKNIKQFEQFINDNFNNPFKRKNIIRIIENPPKGSIYSEPRENELEFIKLTNLDNGRWKIEFKDYTMEYGWGFFIYNQLDNEIEDIERYGYEQQQIPQYLEPTEDTIIDIKKIIQKNKKKV